MSGEPQDKGHAVAVQRALDAYSRARGGFADRQTATMYLLESLERDWNRLVERDGETPGDDVPTFGQMVRAAGRMAKAGEGPVSTDVITLSRADAEKVFCAMCGLGKRAPEVVAVRDRIQSFLEMEMKG